MAEPLRTDAARPTAGPARIQRASGRGVTARGVVALVLLGTAAVGIVELVIVGHRGHLFGVAFAVAAAVGALVVRRRDLPAAMIAPPLLYCVLIGVFSLIDTTDTTGSFLSRRTTYLAIGFVTGAPALWIGTAAAVAIGWYRLRVRRT